MIFKHCVAVLQRHLVAKKKGVLWWWSSLNFENVIGAAAIQDIFSNLFLYCVQMIIILKGFKLSRQLFETCG